MNKQRLKVAIIGTYSFPYGEAASNRILAMAKVIKEAGHDPLVIGRGLPRDCDKSGIDQYTVEGINYWSYGVLEAKTFRQKLNRPVLALDTVNRKYNIDLVIIYACATYMFIPSILRFCKKNNIAVMADVVEWYLPSNFKYGIFNYKYHVFSFVFKHYITKIPKLIVTSTLLKNYFQNRNIDILYIPAIVDVSQIPPNKYYNITKRKFVYAGIPGKKDLLANSIKCLMLLSDEELTHIEYNILGPAKQNIEELLGQHIPERISDVIKIHGRVPVSKVSEILSESDFTILIRRKNRVTQAGFPSKIPEAMGHGVIPILTDTSDLKNFLTDNIDCFFLKNISTEECADAIKKAINITYEQLNIMKKNVFICTRRNFDYNKYIMELRGFLETI